MPNDSRRIPVPESSFNPDLYILEKQSTTLPEEECREDGRLMEECRSLFLKSGVIMQARGSAYIEMKKTKVICGVYGPRDIGRRDDFQMEGVLKCEFKYAPFSCQQRRGHIRNHEEIEYSQVLTQALEPAVMVSKFPKSQVDVYVTVLENDGGALAAAIMAASLALADASIEMYDMVTAYTVRHAGKKMLIHDPTASEEYDPARDDQTPSINHGNITVSLLPLLNQISGVVSSGVMDCDVLADAIDTCATGCQCMYPVMRQAAVDSYKETMLPNGIGT